MSLEIVPAYDAPSEVGTLFTEYTDMLISRDSSFQKYLEMNCRGNSAYPYIL